MRPRLPVIGYRLSVNGYGNFLNRLPATDYRLLFLMPVFALILVAGCAPVISQNILSTVDKNVAFQDIIKNPQTHIGKTVVFGGEIISVENLETTTVVEVLHEAINRRLKPVGAETSAGRFLAVFTGFKDPAVYSKGKLLTIAGIVKGVEAKKLGKMDYNYPVIEETGHYLWTRSREPSFGIGVGVGVSHGF